MISIIVAVLCGVTGHYTLMTLAIVAITIEITVAIVKACKS